MKKTIYEYDGQEFVDYDELEEYIANLTGGEYNNADPYDTPAFYEAMEEVERREVDWHNGGYHEEVDFQAKHLRFEFIGYVLRETRRENAYRVLNKHDDFVLGTIEWFSKWRRYAFFPKEHTCYEEDCLRDIANFCEQRTKKYKERLK